MKAARVVNCPNCGGQVEFRAGASLLSVCSYCSSAVARVGDDITELEILGQVAPLADIGSPLALGTSGRYHSKGFTLVGRVQLNYGAGPWNEWYAAFDDGRWGWLAEAQGKVYLTFGGAQAGLPSYPAARVGSHFKFGKHELTVVERRRAKFVSAEGELPFAVEPGAQFFYCDVEGPNGTFGTIDYGTAPREAESIFLGAELKYDDVFDKSVLRDYQPTEAAAGVGMNCPNCGAAVELRAPDEAQRVTCGSCDSLLDCSKGSELYLMSAARQHGQDPQIPLGSTGKFSHGRYTIYGLLERSVTYDGIKYAWQEYLLREDRRGGYYWLIDNDGHWTFVRPVSAGAVQERGRQARFDERTYRHFSSSTAVVDALRGEFYWKVQVGDRVGTSDYVAPPHILSEERTPEEVTWSAGEYLDKKVVEEAFGLKRPLARAAGIAPNQPNPAAPSLKASFRFGLVFSGLLLLLAMLMSMTSDNQVVLQEQWKLPTKTRGGNEKPRRVKGELLRSKAFEVSGKSALEITMASDVKNGFVFSEGTLIEQTSNKRIPFGVHVASYSGYVGGQTYASGRHARTVYVGGVPGGTYVAEVKPEWVTGRGEPTALTLAVRSDVFIGSHAMIVFFILWLFPLLQGIRYFGFEKRRWMESDHTGV